MDSYTDEDKKRLAPKLQAVIAFMLNCGWYRLDQVAKATGIKEGTVASRLREATDSNHVYLGLAVEKRRVGKGLWEYQLRDREPSQLPLLEGVAA